MIKTTSNFVVRILYTGAVIALVETSYSVYHALSQCSVTGEWFSINGFDNVMLCCAECTKRTNCTAVNYNQRERICEVIDPGDTLMHLEDSPDRVLYYTDIAQIDLKFNAIASQSSTLEPIPRMIKGKTAMYTFDAFYAVDGNYTSNLWTGGGSHTAAGQDQWWMVDVRVSLPVKGVSIVNREDWAPERLSNLRLTVSETLSAVDDVDNVCATFPGPPSPLSLNPVTINCTRTMAGRYVKIVKQDNDGELTLCEVDLIV